MARIADSDDKPKPHKVYEIVVQNLAKTKTGWRTTYSHTIKNDGWEEWNETREDY